MSDRRKIGCLPVAGMMLLAVGIWTAVAATGEPDARDGRDQAVAMCQQFVEEKLRAPATARYSRLEAVGEAPHYVVTGLVDAENALGVPLRSGMTCDLAYVEGDTWRARRVVLERVPDDIARRWLETPIKG